MVDFARATRLKYPRQRVWLGELLLAKGDANGAVIGFSKSLRTALNRSFSLLALARSQRVAADKAAAPQTWTRLLLNRHGSDPDLPLLAEARAATKAS